MTYTVGIILIIIFMLGDNSALAYDESSSFLNHFIYGLGHGSGFHLAGNCLALWLLWRDKIIAAQCKLLILGYFVSVCCSFLPSGDSLTLGFSGVIFSMLGMMVYKLKTTAMFVAQILISMLIPQIAWELHLYCFFLGLVVGKCDRWINKIKYEYRAVNRAG